MFVHMDFYIKTFVQCTCMDASLAEDFHKMLYVRNFNSTVLHYGTKGIFISTLLKLFIIGNT